jgi:DNA replication protein DnaC
VKKGSLFITGQLPLENWHDLFNDPTLGDAIIDRLAYSSHRLKIESVDSMRKITSEL